jgi:hypothetical protein
MILLNIHVYQTDDGSYLNISILGLYQVLVASTDLEYIRSVFG